MLPDPRCRVLMALTILSSCSDALRPSKGCAFADAGFEPKPSSKQKAHAAHLHSKQ